MYLPVSCWSVVFILDEINAIWVLAVMNTSWSSTFFTSTSGTITVGVMFTWFNNIWLTTLTTIKTSGDKSVLDPVFPGGLWKATITPVATNVSTTGKKVFGWKIGGYCSVGMNTSSKIRHKIWLKITEFTYLWWLRKHQKPSMIHSFLDLESRQWMDSLAMLHGNQSFLGDPIFWKI